MKSPLARYALSASAALTLLAGCSTASQAPGNLVPTDAAPAGARHAATSPSFRVLHSFGRHNKTVHDRGGAFPQGGLLDLKGALYGTTSDGGAGHGTVYAMTASGAIKVLYRFRGATADAGWPTGTLAVANGVLYGTTFGGGSCYAGTVYSITTAGKEKLLYSFCDAPQGNPTGTLVAVGDTLYGTEGASTSGYVYSITTSGQYNVLHAFTGGEDGWSPSGRLLNVKGTLYGLTYHGGGYGCASNGHCGTVYSITTSGTEKVVYGFRGGADGWLPYAGLTDVNGTMYGVTYYGGKYATYSAPGSGTVFSVTTNGNHNVLYRFTGGSDGGNPNTSLVAVNGTLYGTTQYGGSAGDGTIFSITPSGAEHVVHSFTGADGAGPAGDLMEVDGTIYGTTYYGGAFSSGCGGKGCGTVFALTP